MVEERTSLRVAAVQMGVTGNQTENLKKICTFMEKASQERVEAIVFPECALSGYPSPSPYADIQSLEKVDPQLIEKNLGEIQDRASKLGIWVCLGTARYRDRGWYNDALLISNKGTVEGVYSKVNFAEQDFQHFIQGNSFTVVDLMGIPVGLQICRDMRFPENWRILKTKGAKIVFHLSQACHSATWKIPVLEGVLRARASENGYFIVSANDAGPLQMFLYAMVNPAGLSLAQANMDSEEMITANLNLAEVNDAHFKARRLDLYNLQFKQQL